MTTFIALYSTASQPLKMIRGWAWSYVSAILASHTVTSAVQYFQAPPNVRFMGMSLIVFGLLGFTLASIFSLIASWFVDRLKKRFQLSKPYRLLWLCLLTLILSEAFTLAAFCCFGVEFFAGKAQIGGIQANIFGHLYSYFVGKFSGSALMAVVYKDNI